MISEMKNTLVEKLLKAEFRLIMLSGSWIGGLQLCFLPRTPHTGLHRNSLVSFHQGKAPLALHFGTIQMSKGEEGCQAFQTQLIVDGIFSFC